MTDKYPPIDDGNTEPIVPDWRNEAAVKRAQIESVLTEMGIVARCAFVPKSASRNRGERDVTLNWRVSIWCAERVLLECDYSQGSAHIPNVQALPRTLYFEGLRKEYEAASETGKYPLNPTRKHVHEHGTRLDIVPGYRLAALPEPSAVDVMASIVSDAQCGSATFPEFCAEFGYDEDSRKSEATWRECAATYDALTRGLGISGFRRLCEVFRDF